MSWPMVFEVNGGPQQLHGMIATSTRVWGGEAEAKNLIQPVALRYED